MLMMKHGRGENVGLYTAEDRKVLDVIYFLHWFGEKHDSIWYDDTEDSDSRGRVKRKKVTFGMFAWAVRCGVISKFAFSAGAPVSGNVLCQLVRMCHGHGF